MVPVNGRDKVRVSHLLDKKAWDPMWQEIIVLFAGKVVEIESQRGGNTDLATLSTIFGFALMMVLEVTIG